MVKKPFTKISKVTYTGTPSKYGTVDKICKTVTSLTAKTTSMMGQRARQTQVTVVEFLLSKNTSSRSASLSITISKSVMVYVILLRTLASVYTMKPFRIAFSTPAKVLHDLARNNNMDPHSVLHHYKYRSNYRERTTLYGSNAAKQVKLSPTVAMLNARLRSGPSSIERYGSRRFHRLY